jgi:hypothetical protein
VYNSDTKQQRIDTI